MGKTRIINDLGIGNINPTERLEVDGNIKNAGTLAPTHADAALATPVEIITTAGGANAVYQKTSLTQLKTAMNIAESDTLQSVTNRGSTTTQAIATGSISSTGTLKPTHPDSALAVPDQIITTVNGSNSAYQKTSLAQLKTAMNIAEADTLQSVTDRGYITTHELVTTSGGATTALSGTSGIGVVGTATNSDFTLYSFGTERVRIQAAGNVGIGSTNPAEKLEVAGNIKASGTLAPTHADSALTTPTQIITTVGGAGATYQKTSIAQLLATLGIPVGGETLQSVTNRGFTTTNKITSSDIITSGTSKGFRNADVTPNAINPIWAFSTLLNDGISYYDGTSIPTGGGVNSIGFHFSNIADPACFIKSNGEVNSARLSFGLKNSISGSRLYSEDALSYTAHSNSANSSRLIFKTSNGTGRGQIIADNINNIGFASSGGVLKLLIDNSGNTIAAGTFSPTHADSALTTPTQIITTAGGAGATYQKTSIAQLLAALGIPVGGETLQSVTNRGFTTTNNVVSSNGTVSNILSYDATGGIIGTSTNHPLQLWTNGASKVNVLANGNVGIGAITPSEKLEVAGNIKADGNFINTNAGKGLFNSGTGSSIVSNGAFGFNMQSGTPSYSWLQFATSSGVNLGGLLMNPDSSFHLLGPPGYTDTKLRIESTGNVFTPGTLSPTHADSALAAPAQIITTAGGTGATYQKTSIEQLAASIGTAVAGDTLQSVTTRSGITTNNIRFNTTGVGTRTIINNQALATDITGFRFLENNVDKMSILLIGSGVSDPNRANAMEISSSIVGANFQVKLGGLPSLKILAAGTQNVGIGVDIPTEKLEVNGNIKNAGTLAPTHADSALATPAQFITAVSGSNATYQKSSVAQVQAALGISAGGGTVLVGRSLAGPSNTALETTLIPATITGSTSVTGVQAGTSFEIEFDGRYRTTGSPTLTLKFYISSVASPIAATIAFVPGASIATLQPFWGKLRFTVFTTPGASADGLVTGNVKFKQADLGAEFTMDMSTAVTASNSDQPITVNIPSSFSMNLTAQWGTASASNIFDVNNIAIKRLN